MIDSARVVSKVLVIDSDMDIFPVTKLFCIETNLVGLRAHKDNVIDILRSNVDLGAILLAESYGGDPAGGIALASQIHQLRPELPIFLRREHRDDLDGLDEQTRRMFCAAYTIGSMFRLHKYVEEYIFSFVYPNVLVRGIREITEQTLVNQFGNALVSCDTPYMVRDPIICGEVFSLIPIETSWCRGYMMLQADDSAAHQGAGSSAGESSESGFRNISNAMGEITNLVWGAFKSRYMVDGATRAMSQIQVPILIKLKQKYISFGSADPQLCFKYTLSDIENAGKPPIYLYQRFIFNLNWSPEDFTEVPASTEDLVESGELEMF